MARKSALLRFILLFFLICCSLCKLYQAKYQSPKNAEYLGAKTLMIKLCRLREISNVQTRHKAQVSRQLIRLSPYSHFNSLFREW